ncbi:MAG: hypothetical protein RBU37_06685 [Myxococcota bacterium]|jgi:hypothetical protein|nr:hypothetical protein [Myxococcota bacterium]
MSQMVDVRAVSGILFGVYKALFEVTGASSAAIMRKASPDILSELEKMGVDFSTVNSIERLEMALRNTMVSAGMCDDMSFSLDGDKLQTNIKGCAFHGLTSDLKKEGIPPFGCPFAAVTLALAERNLGMRARVVELQPTPGGALGDTQMVVQLHAAR